MKTVLLCFSLLLTAASAPKSEVNPTEIVQKTEDKLRGDQSYSELSMTIVRPTWNRTIKMKSWSKGTRHSLILITYPARDKGTVFLKKDKEIYNWIPSIERQIKLPPSMMNQSWMGSDFTNDDLVSESSLVNDYTHTLLGEVELDGRKAWKIELKPKEDAAVVWGKIILHIDQAEYLHLKTEFYDEEEDLVNIMTAKKIGVLGGKTLPTLVEMEPIGKPGNKTILEYQALDFTVNIPNEYFTTQYMKRVR